MPIGGFGSFNLAPVSGPPSRGLVAHHKHARQSRWIRFRLNSDLATSDDEADADVVQSLCGQSVSSPTINNTGNIFYGEAGAYGWAEFDFITKTYAITYFPCCAIPFSDDFSTAKSGWTHDGLAVSSGTLNATGGTTGGSYRCACVKSFSTVTAQVTLSNLAVELSDETLQGLRIVTSGDWSGSGQDVTLQSVANTSGPLEYRWTAGSASGTISVVPTGAPGYGDIIKIVLEESGGNVDAKFYINDSLEHTESAIDNTFARKILMGVTFTHTFTIDFFSFDDFSTSKT